jgi:hypothetical protein
MDSIVVPQNNSVVPQTLGIFTKKMSGMFTRKNQKEGEDEQFKATIAAENKEFDAEKAAELYAENSKEDPYYEKITNEINYNDGINFYIKDKDGKYRKQNGKILSVTGQQMLKNLKAKLNLDGNPLIDCNNCYIKKTEKEEIKAKYILPLPEDAGSDVKPFVSGKKKGLFSSSQSSELDLLSAEYDAFNQRVENLNSVFLVIASAGAITAAVGFTVITAGVGAIPILTLIAFLPLIGRSAQLFPAQWWKSSELQYISGACCAMVTNMSDDLIKLRKFYKITSDIQKDKSNTTIIDELKKNSHSIDEYLQPAGLYIPVEKNLYKFMFILLNAIDFNASKEKLGDMQYNFILGLFNYCDFENSKYTIVNGKAQLSEEEIKTQKIGKFKYRYTYADNCGFDIWKEDNISETQYGNENNYARSCNNYNDTIVRLLEHKFLSAKDVLTQISNLTSTSNEQKAKIEKFLKKSSSSSSTMFSRAAKQFKETFVGNPNQSYREMLREYTIMAANWGMITSKYAIQYSEFILFVGAEKYKPLLNALDGFTSTLETQIEKDNIKVTGLIQQNSTNDVFKALNNSQNDDKDLREDFSGGRLKSKRQRNRAATTKKRKNRK